TEVQYPGSVDLVGNVEGIVPMKRQRGVIGDQPRAGNAGVPAEPKLDDSRGDGTGAGISVIGRQDQCAGASGAKGSAAGEASRHDQGCSRGDVQVVRSGEVDRADEGVRAAAIDHTATGKVHDLVKDIGAVGPEIEAAGGIDGDGGGRIAQGGGSLDAEESFVDGDGAEAAGPGVHHPDFVYAGFGQGEVVSVDDGRGVGADIPTADATQAGIAREREEPQRIELLARGVDNGAGVAQTGSLNGDRFGAEVDGVDVQPATSRDNCPAIGHAQRAAVAHLQCPGSDVGGAGVSIVRGQRQDAVAQLRQAAWAANARLHGKNV